MSRNDKLDQFDELIDELQQSKERPFAPRAFKNELRRQLLSNYGKSSFSWGTLGRWAGTAVALGVLAFIVIYAWGVIIRPASVAGPVSVTRPAAPVPSATPSPLGIQMLTDLPAEMGDNLRLLDFTFTASPFAPGGPVQIHFAWEATGRPSADYTVFVHLVDESGQLIAQTEQSIGFSSTFVNGTRPSTSLTVWLPDELPAATVSLVVGLYDSVTGQRLPPDSPGLYLAQIDVAEETAVAPPAQHAANDVWLISAIQHARTSADATITLEITVGYQFASDEEVMLKPLYANPNWESATGGRIPLDGLSDEILLTEKSGTETITFSASPAEMRQIAGADQPVLVMQMGYLSEDENGRRELNILAMPTMSGFVIDLTSTAEITFNSDGATAVIPRAVVSGTDNNGLTLRRTPTGQTIAILQEGSIVLLTDVPRQESEGLLWQAVETTDGHTGWVVAEFLTYPARYVPVEGQPPAEMTVPTEEAGPVYLESVVQKERHTAVVTFQVIVEHAILDATLQLFLVNPDWDYDQTNIQSFQQFMPQPGQPGLSVTATPDQIREATGTDYPIVAAITKPIDPTNGTAIVQKFPEFPFDLTSREEIWYTPINDTKNRNYLNIVELSPPVGSTMNGEMTFTLTVQYNLLSLDTANLVTMLMPYEGGSAVVGNDVQTITRGEGEITFSFNFEPLVTNVASNWVLEIRMVDPAEEFPQSALATASPHDNFPDDVYRFEP